MKSDNQLFCLVLFLLVNFSMSEIIFKQSGIVPMSRQINENVILEEYVLETEGDFSSKIEIPLGHINTEMNLIDYYFPYFFKTGVLTLTDSPIFNSTNSSISCTDDKCKFCDKSDNDFCLQCNTGYFLNKFHKCVEICPEETVADVLRFKCSELKANNYTLNNSTSQHRDVYFTKAFTKGSCSNMCGKNNQDCSCMSNCKYRGNCCTDYNCDQIIKKSSEADTKLKCEQNENCIYCDDKLKISNEVPKCNQCREGFYLFEGKCVFNCPDSTKADKNNFRCEKKPTCEVANCDLCEENNQINCKSCERGYFMHKNKCLEKCLKGQRADRMTWSCKEESQDFAWYWVYPSKGSCRSQCGLALENKDCSCHDDCFQMGNCCQDIEEFCPDMLFWKKNSKKYLRKQKNN